MLNLLKLIQENAQSIQTDTRECSVYSNIYQIKPSPLKRMRKPSPLKHI